MTASGGWATVLVQPHWRLRFAPFCHRCGRAPGVAAARARVHFVTNARTSAVKHDVPRWLEVPVCARCRWRWLLVVAAVVLLLAIPAVGIARGGRSTAPIPLAPCLARIVALLALAAAGWLVFVAFRTRFDAAWDGEHLRCSFRDPARARDFAAANGGTVAGERPARGGAEAGDAADGVDPDAPADVNGADD